MSNVIKINNYSDFKQIFGNQYCNSNKEIRNEYIEQQFVFILKFSNEMDKVWIGFKAIENKYGNKINISVHIKIDIQNSNDYACFYNYFTEWSNDGKCMIKKIYSNVVFVFNIQYLNTGKVNELLIHNYLLLVDKFSDSDVFFQLNINKKYEGKNMKSEKNSDIGRINTYIAEHNSNDKYNIYINDNHLKWNVTSINKLFPAISIDYNTLEFLRNTINHDVWKEIVGYKKINENTFKSGTQENKHWLLLRACQNYLFDDFENASYAYAILRKLVYSNPMFYEKHIKSMPLLAVVVFAQYDYFFRDNMLNMYKNAKSIKSLNCTDFIVNLQEKQNVNNYIAHKNMVKSGYNIKTLLKYDYGFDTLEKNISKSDFYHEIINATNAKLIKEVVKEFWVKYYLPQLYQNMGENYLQYVDVKMNNSTLSKTIFLFLYYKYLLKYMNGLFNYDEEEFLTYFSKALLPKYSVTIKNHQKMNNTLKKQIYKKIHSIVPTDIDTVSKKLKNSLKSIVLSDEEKEILDVYVKGLKIHDDIVAELFEATTIAEGLLQLIENSVVYADGGLLSIRIRNINDIDDQNYLKKQEYKKYFDTIKHSAKFYLEVKLSDISNVNLKEKFFSNVIKRAYEIKTLSLWKKKFQDRFSKNKIYEDFFAPNKDVQKAWEEYYLISENQVHHYGLQIFDSVVTSKNGLFCASGHGDSYVNVDDWKITDDKDIPGTSYRILLPLNHSHVNGKNIINDIVFEKTIGYNTLKEFYPRKTDDINTVLFPSADVISFIQNHFLVESKENIIKSISDIIYESIHDKNNFDKKYLLLVNYNQLGNPSNFTTELIIKGLLLCIFRIADIDNIPPIAIINMSSHILLETSRIIALFYNKHGKSTEKMKNVQIYLKGNELGEEILFAGNNLNQNAERMRKIAMTRGIMFDYWQVAQILVQRTNKE